MRRTRQYLLDILTSLNDVDDFVKEGESDFFSNRKTQAAVIRTYEVIGEVTKRLPQELLDKQPHIDWKAIKGFRDVLIHQYDNIDLAIVWDAVLKQPELRKAVEDLLQATTDDNGE
jgi:uncharacterized protein with HEPN domain